MDIYSLMKPLLLRLPPEAAHGLALRALKAGLLPSSKASNDPILETTCWGRRFNGPLGLAAGFDKNAEALAPLLALGFSFVEAGTVTPKAQAGNTKPRIFRDARHAAIINAMGFPGKGLGFFRQEIERYRAQPGAVRPMGIIGINIGMNKDQTEPAQDYRTLVRALGPLADYLTVNISSPNTPGLRNLQEPPHLAALLAEILAERAVLSGEKPPLLVKLSPDIDRPARPEIAQTLLAAGIDGLVLTNTTLSRPETLPPDFAARKGGLSGRPLRDRALETLRDFYRLTDGRLPIIAAGGIGDADDAYARLRAGASLLQIYSSLVFTGPGVIKQIHDGLAALLRRDGFAALSEAVGVDVKG